MPGKWTPGLWSQERRPSELAFCTHTRLLCSFPARQLLGGAPAPAADKAKLLDSSAEAAALPTLAKDGFILLGETGDLGGGKRQAQSKVGIP